MQQKGGTTNFTECRIKYISIGTEYKIKFKRLLKKFKKNNKMLLFYNIYLHSFGNQIGK